MEPHKPGVTHAFNESEAVGKLWGHEHTNSIPMDRTSTPVDVGKACREASTRWEAWTREDQEDDVGILGGKRNVPNTPP